MVNKLKSNIDDETILNLITKVITQSTVDVNTPFKQRIKYNNKEGLPQGLSISGLLSEIYLFDLVQKYSIKDNLELNKINTILKDDKKQINDEADWKDISEIIDEALDEVKDYEFSLDNNKYHLVLNRFKIDELRPLLTKLDQNIIDRLVSGESVDINISIKE